MRTNKLHIVSFDVPYPPDYGGAIDVYYKIKSLHEAGAEIYLHCYQYGRPESEDLKKYCKEVWYYPRKTGVEGLSLTLPYIVNSRRNQQLLMRLQSIDAPILFEGAHTTYHLSHPSLKNRFKAVRAHNIEHDYYAQLGKKEPKFLNRFYFNMEARLLKKYESHLQDAQAIFPLSIADNEYFKELYPAQIHEFVAPFHPYSEVTSQPGKGAYCFYHGNLAHGENVEATLFLINDIFSKINTPLIIAGRAPANSIIDACKTIANCKLIANPTADEMDELIANAQIHVLPTFQATGMKLKLLYSLFGGRHVIVNNEMVHGTGLDKQCTIADSAASFIENINRLAGIEYTEADIAIRKKALAENFSNSANAQKLLTYLQQ